MTHLISFLFYRFACSENINSEDVSSIYMRCCKCNEMGIPWEFKITKNLAEVSDELGLLNVVYKQLEKHAAQHGEVSERLYAALNTAIEAIKKLNKTQVTVIVPPGLKLEELTKREIVKLLERAVMDGKVKDCTLFEYEAGFVSMPPSDVMTILYQYKYGKTNVKVVVSDDAILPTRRLLRPVELY